MHASYPSSRFPSSHAHTLRDSQVRGLIVQIGFHEHMRESLIHSPAGDAINHGDEYTVGLKGITPQWDAPATTLFSVAFFTVMGIAIALMKDVPDVEGDAEFGVMTLAVRCGGDGVVRICNLLLGVIYLASAAFWASPAVRGRAPKWGVAVAHLAIGGLLVRKLQGTDVGSAASMRSSYMAIWKAFYLEYVLLAVTLV